MKLVLSSNVRNELNKQFWSCYKFLAPLPGIMKEVLGSSVRNLVNINWSLQVFGVVARDETSPW